MIVQDLYCDRDRTPSSSQEGSHWFHDFCSLGDKFVLQHQSLDGYLFLRFFKIIISICFVGSCMTWPILFPVNATGGGGASQLDKLTFSNINDNGRLYAHAIISWLFLGKSSVVRVYHATNLISRSRPCCRYTGTIFPHWYTSGISLFAI
jgi:Late exocytosis, associated with Golgi transport